MATDMYELIRKMNLVPHPEGGFYRETYRSELQVLHPGIPSEQDRNRTAGTSIYFLLPGDDFSAIHRVKWTDETWHAYAGSPLELHLIHQDGRYECRVLTTELSLGEPTIVVKAGCWQAARVVPGGEWALAGCTLAPGFEFADFEMPGREHLLSLYPKHETIINELTKH